MARKTKEEALKTREAILDAAIRVFSVQGVSRATLADIAHQAGVTRGAIYWHFKNKEALLSELWQKVLLPFEPINQLSEDPEDPDPLGKLLRTYFSFFKKLEEDKKMRQIIQILLDKCEAVKDTATMELRRANCHCEGQRKIETILSNAIRQGQLPETLDVRMGSIATLAFIDGLVSNWTIFPHLLDINRDIPAMLNALTQMLRYGFSKPVGDS